jgi:hypothetical protein
VASLLFAENLKIRNPKHLPAPPRQAGWQVIVSWMIIIALQSSAFSLNT